MDFINNYITISPQKLHFPSNFKMRYLNLFENKIYIYASIFIILVLFERENNQFSTVKKKLRFKLIQIFNDFCKTKKKILNLFLFQTMFLISPKHKQKLKYDVCMI